MDSAVADSVVPRGLSAASLSSGAEMMGVVQLISVIEFPVLVLVNDRREFEPSPPPLPPVSSCPFPPTGPVSSGSSFWQAANTASARNMLRYFFMVILISPKLLLCGG